MTARKAAHRVVALKPKDTWIEDLDQVEAIIQAAIDAAVADALSQVQARDQDWIEEEINKAVAAERERVLNACAKYELEVCGIIYLTQGDGRPILGICGSNGVVG